ncbi:MAG: LacI family transcriptional regulator [Spirochaetia bacterium]|nr:LacI family transcriptional regulator [Spirochaetia bacterium]
MATIKDVAKLAGVSYNTVSFVVNGVDKVAPATKERVLKAIEELRYRPNKTARALVGGKADSIAFISTRFTSVFGMNILREIEDGVHLAGLSSNLDLIPFSTRGEPELKEQIIESIIHNRKADAIIMLGIKPGPGNMAKLKEEGMPLVIIDGTIEGASCVKCDNEKGAFLAADYLIKAGRKNIAYLGMSKNDGETWPSIIEKEQGYKKALSAKNIPINDRLMVTVENNYVNEGRAIMQTLLKSNKGIDAVFCGAGDSTAIGAIKAIQEAGLCVPQDIAVVGYDDIPVASAFTPALTTVRQSVEKIGNEAFLIALEAMQGRLKEQKNLVFEPELIKRESA